MDYYVVQAFSARPDAGNPAGVVLLEHAMTDEWMQGIAREKGHSETAFVWQEGAVYHIRWFTPTKEVPICGHATLASSFVISHFVDSSIRTISFQSKTELLTVDVTDEQFTLHFSAVHLHSQSITSLMNAALGTRVEEAYLTEDGEHLVLVVANQAAVESIIPDLEIISQLAPHGVTVTASGQTSDVDYVLRYFAPNYGIAEDPVTGSAQTRLAPLWAQKLGKKVFVAHQLSRNQGWLTVELQGQEVLISGEACLVHQGKIH